MPHRSPATAWEGRQVGCGRRRRRRSPFGQLRLPLCQLLLLVADIVKPAGRCARKSASLSGGQRAGTRRGGLRGAAAVLHDHRQHSLGVEQLLQPLPGLLQPLGRHGDFLCSLRLAEVLRRCYQVPQLRGCSGMVGGCGRQLNWAVLRCRAAASRIPAADLPRQCSIVLALFCSGQQPARQASAKLGQPRLTLRRAPVPFVVC